ncbi:MAG: TIGR03619 family F420-dependent LLM class oxidoreductase [Deltaproteobacteria bacterium]|nr:MAG: TIGR03619 family F420-dependent LLM class oxidoreductase [Deltaproteobacteria bacterium]
MKLGVHLRVMGTQSTPELLRECARSAEELGLDELWVADHIAIPPDDAEGSGGRYLDPLATLAFLAAATQRIGLGTAVLNLPYRPALPTAKWVATIQELSGGRLRLGVGLGWMEAEFRALGVSRKRRGAITDATLEFLQRAFAADEMEANNQRFLFLPRPKRPPIFIGGAAPHALRRAVRYGDGWMPMTSDPEPLRPQIAELRRLAEEAGRDALEVVVLTMLPLHEPQRAAELALVFAEIGVTRLIHAPRYEDGSEFQRSAETLAKSVREALTNARPL